VTTVDEFQVEDIRQGIARYTSVGPGAPLPNGEYVRASDLDGAIQAGGRVAAALAKALDALRKIAEFDPGEFRSLEDEVAIWKIATEALGLKADTKVSGGTKS
jgi:hypothetical protein